MLGRGGILLVIAGLVLLPLSCAKIPEAPSAEEGDLVIEALPHVDSLPAKWGKLVSVSSVPGQQYSVHLWFQDDNGNIRIVKYGILENRFVKDVRVIGRK